jgi:excisionase family DNA binding protein
MAKMTVTSMDDMLSTPDAAAELGIGLRRVQVLIDNGRLPATKIGKVWIIRRADLELVRERPTGRPRKSPEEAKGETAVGDKKKPSPKKKPKRS